ncbi:MAG TPA: GNAT family N-acetyltransferase [Burkholderiales bacterium]|nr:GNAT family N-acetyltransferase [Burkholderiales bacterium]
MDPFDFYVGDCDALDRFLAERIYEFNVQATSYSDGESFAAVRRDESGSIVAGISGYTWGGCCYVAHLWVSEPLRARGLGRALLSAAEAHAKRKDCKIVLLASHSFQSPAFYENLGYVRQASVADHPVGHSNIVFAKRFA